MKKIIALLLLFCFLAPSLPAGAALQSKVKLDVFFESMDGRGWQWFFLSDALRRARTANIEVNVFCILAKDKKGQWSSKRGEREIAESKRIAIIKKYHKDALSNYLNARSLSPWADGWKDSAIFSDIDIAKLEKEIKANGNISLNEHYAKMTKYGVTAASVFINGKQYKGSPKLLDMMRVLNKVLPKGKKFKVPAAKKISKLNAPKFWIVLSENTAPKDERVISAFARFFTDLKLKEIQYSSKTRKSKFKDLDFIPAYIIEDNKNSRAALGDMIKAGVFVQKKGYLVYYDKSKRGVFVKNKTKPRTLELFTMSQCPYGVMAENSLMEAVEKKLIAPKTKVKIRYIADGSKGKDGKINFKSLHGPAEWEENVRQLFIAEKFPDKLFAYLTERNKNVKSTQWEVAAKAAGISAKAVAKGFKKGKDMLFKDSEYTKKLGIFSSPSFLVDGKYFAIGMRELTKMKGFEKVPLKASNGGACK
ncbi:MAG: hypothetical protein U9Q34_00020 [Elusimicrobiota bacterium]|nr:hypothetical protein [Elusimicrobiota bacterium]